MFPKINWLPLAIGFAAGFGLCWLVHSVIMNSVNVKHAAELKAQETRMLSACSAQKAVTEEANGKLQNNYDRIAADLVAANKRLRTHCVVPTTKPSDPTESGKREYAIQNGISAEWLNTYAAECEQYRSERIELEVFMNHVWEMQCGNRK